MAPVMVKAHHLVAATRRHVWVHSMPAGGLRALGRGRTDADEDAARIDGRHRHLEDISAKTWSAVVRAHVLGPPAAWQHELAVKRRQSVWRIDGAVTGAFGVGGRRNRHDG